MTSKTSLPPFISEYIFLTSFQPVFPAKSDGKENPPQARSKSIERETQLFFEFSLSLTQREGQSKRNAFLFVCLPLGEERKAFGQGRKGGGVSPRLAGPWPETWGDLLFGRSLYP